jgi:hypothetical protein
MELSLATDLLDRFDRDTEIIRDGIQQLSASEYWRHKMTRQQKQRFHRSTNAQSRDWIMLRLYQSEFFSNNVQSDAVLETAVLDALYVIRDLLILLQWPRELVRPTPDYPTIWHALFRATWRYHHRVTGIKSPNEWQQVMNDILRCGVELQMPEPWPSIQAPSAQQIPLICVTSILEHGTRCMLPLCVDWVDDVLPCANIGGDSVNVWCA